MVVQAWTNTLGEEWQGLGFSPGMLGMEVRGFRAQMGGRGSWWAPRHELGSSGLQLCCGWFGINVEERGDAHRGNQMYFLMIRTTANIY